MSSEVVHGTIIMWCLPVEKIVFYADGKIRIYWIPTVHHPLHYLLRHLHPRLNSLWNGIHHPHHHPLRLWPVRDTIPSSRKNIRNFDRNYTVIRRTMMKILQKRMTSSRIYVSKKYFICILMNIQLISILTRTTIMVLLGPRGDYRGGGRRRWRWR